jgi:hypothetical protein
MCATVRMVDVPDGSIIEAVPRPTLVDTSRSRRERADDPGLQSVRMTALAYDASGYKVVAVSLAQTRSLLRCLQ